MSPFSWVGLASFVLIGCATTEYKTLQSYREHLEQRRWPEALELARGPKFYRDEESKLLKWLEQGMLYHLDGKYFQSQEYFDRAQKLSEKLFTVAVSKKLLKSIGSDSLDHFYGEIYERSMLRLYSALNHYLLYQQGFRDRAGSGEKSLSERERRRHLEAARAIVVEWNSKIGEWRDERVGKTVFKDDLMAKVFGAFIHEQIGSRGDRQIAKLLYGKGRETLFQNYNAYPTFNTRFEKFKKDFDELPKLKKVQVKKDYLSSTKPYKGLDAYLKKRSKGKETNVTVLIHHGFIEAKRPKKHRYPLSFASHLKTALTGKMSIVDFTIQILGLSTLGEIPAIEFELPEIPSRPERTRFVLQVLRKGKLFKSKPIPLINPLNDIAREAMEEHALSTRIRLGMRLASKHMVAIVSAYKAYNAAIERGVPGVGAKMMATGLYAASTRAIALSEKADLRSWSSLPQSLNMLSFSLEPGTYQLSLLKQSDGKEEPVTLSELVVERGKSQLLSARVF